LGADQHDLVGMHAQRLPEKRRHAEFSWLKNSQWFSCKKITRSEPLFANLHKIFIIRTWGTRSNFKTIHSRSKRNYFDRAQYQLEVTSRTRRSQQIYRGGARRLAWGRRKFTKIAPALLVALYASVCILYVSTNKILYLYVFAPKILYLLVLNQYIQIRTYTYIYM
jgi:hypothetical protein